MNINKFYLLFIILVLLGSCGKKIGTISIIDVPPDTMGSGSNPSVAALSSLVVLNTGQSIDIGFSTSLLSYTFDVSVSTSSLKFMPIAQSVGSLITINGTSVSSGSTSGDILLNFGDNNISIIVTSPGGSVTKTYNLHVNRGLSLQNAYIKASNTDADDNFGFSVSISGDTMVVGAYKEDSNATGVNGDDTDNSALNSGAVYIFVRDGSTWSQQAYLKASNTDANDNFGFSVGISGDTVVVGANGEDSNATGVNGDDTDDSALGSGAAYVFVRDGSTWSQQAYLKASNTEAVDNFGFSVSASGDTIVVGANQEDSNATGVDGDDTDNSASASGAVYVFVRDGSTWSQQAYLKASNTETNDYFGRVVKISGDTIVVGANQEDSDATGVDGDDTNNSASYSGAAYVFVRDGSTWSQQAYLKASNTEANDHFGFSVGISGDTIAVGANQEDSDATGVDGDDTDNSASASGATYIFVRDGSTWSQQAYLKASNTEANDSFGFKLSIDGDAVIVGANGEDSNATGLNGDETDNSESLSGAAYIFVRDGNDNWSQQSYIKASNTEADDRFGISMEISGDTIVVGANGEDSNATGIDGDDTDNSASFSGAVYLLK